MTCLNCGKIIKKIKNLFKNYKEFYCSLRCANRKKKVLTDSYENKRNEIKGKD